MMDASDNVMAECIAREVAAATHRPRSFAGAVDAVISRLAAAGVDTSGATLVDSSGLSLNDRLTAKTLDSVVQAAAGRTSRRCGRCWICCRSPAAAARCPTVSSTPPPTGSRRAGCGPRPVH
ncbi:D-Ala-D-Ala carboxypeptidase 3 family protein [Mycobacterium xenopi 3993]|nr:D-Ala-D-Ala carboxypeptidase 3 family protein [Mycobacterium xenopi 3993]